VKFQSTRNKNLRLDSAETIIKGLSDEGGLFVPEEVPHLEKEELAELSKLDYCERAKRVFAKYMTDFSEEELLECAEKAYIGRFEDDTPAPLVNWEKARICSNSGTDQPVHLKIWHCRYFLVFL